MRGRPSGLELARRGRGVERSVEPQTGDAGHALLDKAGEELESGETAVRHEHERSLWHPAASLQDQLPRPIRQRLVSPAVLAAVALRGGERGQKR